MQSPTVLSKTGAKQNPGLSGTTTITTLCPQEKSSGRPKKVRCTLLPELDFGRNDQTECRPETTFNMFR